jgi:hypothetical protein
VCVVSARALAGQYEWVDENREWSGTMLQRWSHTSSLSDTFNVTNTSRV